MPLKVVYFRSSTLVYFYISIDNYSDFAHFNLRFIEVLLAHLKNFNDIKSFYYIN